VYLQSSTLSKQDILQNIYYISLDILQKYLFLNILLIS